MPEDAFGIELIQLYFDQIFLGPDLCCSQIRCFFSNLVFQVVLAAKRIKRAVLNARLRVGTLVGQMVCDVRMFDLHFLFVCSEIE